MDPENRTNRVELLLSLVRRILFTWNAGRNELTSPPPVEARDTRLTGV